MSFEKIEDLSLIQSKVCNSLVKVSRGKVTPVLDPAEMSYQFVIVVEDPVLRRLFGKGYRPELDPRRITPGDKVRIIPRVSLVGYDKEISPDLGPYDEGVHTTVRMSFLWSFKKVHDEAEAVKADANSVVLWSLRPILEDYGAVDGFVTITSVEIQFKVTSGDDDLPAVAKIRGWRRRGEEVGADG